MKASNWSRSTRPKFHDYVMVELPKVFGVPVIVQAMRTHGFLDKASFGWALSPGHPPLLHLVPNLRHDNGKKVFGYTPPNPPIRLPDGTVPPTNSILIDEVLANEFDTKAGGRLSNTSGDPSVNRQVFKLGATILHELCHWGDLRAHGRFTDTGSGQEHGDAFEFEVYGALL